MPCSEGRHRGNAPELDRVGVSFQPECAGGGRRAVTACTPPVLFFGRLQRSLTVTVAMTAAVSRTLRSTRSPLPYSPPRVTNSAGWPPEFFTLTVKLEVEITDS